MNFTDILLLVLLIAATVVATIFYMQVKSLKTGMGEREMQIRQLQAAERSAAERLAQAMAGAARESERAESYRRELAAANEAAGRNEERFRQLAATVMTDEIGRMKSENEVRLLELLTPFREQISGFREQVEKCYASESRERFALKAEIARLVSQSETIGREAKELATALRGNSKTQGDWGEMILERLLEKSGLRKGEEFEVQQTRDIDGNLMRGDDGLMLRPDVVVYYPGRRAAVIDSKVSLTAFTDWVNSDDDDARRAAGRRHVDSVRSHIAELRRKRYEDFVSDRKLDFVLMFIPNESAYIAAMSLDPGLWQEAYDSRVLIVSPTHLISVLRLVAQLWAHDRQTSNALKIAESAGNLYDKFVGFIEEMDKIDRAIGSASQAWHNAMKRLRDGRGNLMSRAEELRKLGVKTRKSLAIESGDSREPGDSHDDASES